MNLVPSMTEPAAHGEQKVDLLAAGQINGLHQGFVGGIGLDAGEFEDGEVLEGGLDLGQGAGLDHAAARRR